MFGPRPRDYRSKLNKKIERLARKIAFTSKANDKQIFVVENFTFDAPRTKSYVELAKNFKLDDKKVLPVFANVDRNVLLGAQRAQRALMAQAIDLNAYTVLNNDAILLTEDSVGIINDIK